MHNHTRNKSSLGIGGMNNQLFTTIRLDKPETTMGSTVIGMNKMSSQFSEINNKHKVVTPGNGSKVYSGDNSKVYTGVENINDKEIKINIKE